MEEKEIQEMTKREMIAEVGKTRKLTIRRDELLCFAFLGAYILVGGGLSIYLVLLSSNYFYPTLLLTSFMGIGVLMSVLKKVKELMNISLADDYNAGVYFVKTDKRVKGNSLKKKKSMRLNLLLASVIMFIFGTAFLVTSLTTKHLDVNSLEKVTGTLEKYTYTNGYLNITLTNDKTEYIVSKNLTPYITEDEFKKETETDKSLTLSLVKSEDKEKKEVLLLSSSKTDLLSYTEYQLYELNIDIVNYSLCGLGYGVAVAIVAFYVIEVLYLLPKNMAGEIYELRNEARTK